MINDFNAFRSSSLLFKTRNYFFGFLIIVIIVAHVGCIRLSAGAGYSYQGKNDDAPKTKSVGFDTQDIIEPGRAKGSITT